MKTTKKPLKPESRMPVEFVLTITKTVQIPKFEPSTVSLSEKHVVEEDENYDTVFRQVRQQVSDKVERSVVLEVKRYASEGKEK